MLSVSLSLAASNIQFSRTSSFTSCIILTYLQRALKSLIVASFLNSMGIPCSSLLSPALVAKVSIQLFCSVTVQDRAGCIGTKMVIPKTTKTGNRMKHKLSNMYNIQISIKQITKLCRIRKSSIIFWVRNLTNYRP